MRRPDADSDWRGFAAPAASVSMIPNQLGVLTNDLRVGKRIDAREAFFSFKYGQHLRIVRDRLMDIDANLNKFQSALLRSSFMV